MSLRHSLFGEDTPASDPPEAPSHLDGIILGHEAYSWEDLVRDLRPTLTWNHCDMLWVTVDASGKPSFFDLDRAYLVRDSGKWVTLDDDGTPGGPGVRSLAGGYTGVRAPLLATLEGHDSGPASQALVLSENPRFGTLYRIYWEARLGMGSGCYQEGRWILALRGRNGSWQLIGELPGELSGRQGGGHSVRANVEMRASWTGDPGAPVRIDLTKGSYDDESGEGAIGLPSLATFQDGVLEGSPPAKLRWATSEYVVAEPGDSMEAVVHRLSVWSVGYSVDRPEGHERIKAIHRKALRELNTALPEDDIPEGTRINVLSYENYLKALSEADRAKSPRPQEEQDRQETKG